MNEEDREKNLARLREPFHPEQIGKLPRKTKGGGTIHLDFVGHAHITDRLLDVDPYWTWEPVATAEDGTPVVLHSTRVEDDETIHRFSFWIKLTVCGVTRLGVGIVVGQKDELEKELISDALRNAAMRFGVALDLWTKVPLHVQENNDTEQDPDARAQSFGYENFEQMDLAHAELDREVKAAKEAGLLTDEQITELREQYGETRRPLPANIAKVAREKVAMLIADGTAQRGPDDVNDPAPKTGFENWSRDDIVAEVRETHGVKVTTKADGIKWLRDHGIPESDERPM